MQLANFILHAYTAAASAPRCSSTNKYVIHN